jgi:4'-phosphopantetheinyl transferase EntD
MGSVSHVKDALDLIVASVGAVGVVTGARPIDPADSDGLYDVECEAVSGAVPGRRAEFASGRTLLRSLIDDDVPIPMMSDRRPLLPPGIRASLAHDEQFVVAVLSRGDDIVSLGVDIEPYRALEPGVVSIITRADELDIDPLVLFCVKEAVYKAWSQSGGGFLEHGDVRVELDGSTFTAEVLEPGVVLQGGWAVVDGRCLAVAVLRPGAVPDGSAAPTVTVSSTPGQVSRVDCR